MTRSGTPPGLPRRAPWSIVPTIAGLALALTPLMPTVTSAQDDDFCDRSGLQICMPGSSCVAADDALTISAEGVGRVNIRGNDTCPPEFISEVEVIHDPDAGVSSLDDDGTLTFRLLPGVPPPESLRYRLLDGRGEPLAEATISIRLAPGGPLLARDDTWEGHDDQVARIDVLENDSIPEGGRPTLEVVSPPAQGTLRLSDDGQALDFTPPDGFSGTLEARYRLTDRLGRQSEARIILKGPTPSLTCPAPGEGWSMFLVPAGTWTADGDRWLSRLGRSIGATEVELTEPICISATEVTRQAVASFVGTLSETERAPWLECPPPQLSDVQPCLTPEMAGTYLEWLNANQDDGRFALPTVTQWLAALFFLKSGPEDAVPNRDAVFDSMILSLREWTRTPCSGDGRTSNTFKVVGLDEMTRNQPDQGALCRIATIPESYIGLRVIFEREGG